MSLEKIRISVIVPVFNVGDYVNECLSSIVNQEEPFDEVIIVDDGSTDISSEIVQHFVSNNTNWLLIRQKNSGLLAARRAGFCLATGDFIASVDGDDVVNPYYVSKIKSVIRARNPDIIFFKLQRFTDELVWEELESSTLRIFPILKDYVLRMLVTTSSLNSLCTKVIRRSCIDISNNYSQFGRINRAEDLLQTVSCVISANEFMILDSILYGYRNRSGSITNIRPIAQSVREVVIARLHLGRSLERLLGPNHDTCRLWRPALALIIIRMILPEVFRWNTNLQTLRELKMVIVNAETEMCYQDHTGVCITYSNLKLLFACQLLNIRIFLIRVIAWLIRVF